MRRCIIIILLAIVILSYPIEKHAANFSDIAGTWYEQTVINATEKGWANGYPDGSFKGDSTITRAEFITIINRMVKNNIMPIGESKFSDVVFGDWYYIEVLKAINIGIVNGFEDGTFRPNAYITRGDAMVMLSRINELPKVKDNFNIPKDYNMLPAYAQDPISVLYQLRIVKGDEDANVNAYSNITRGEAITLIERTYNTINNLLPEFIEPEFKIKLNDTFNYELYVTNSDELYNYSFEVKFEDEELNSFNYYNYLYDVILKQNIDSKYIINEIYSKPKDVGIFFIDNWNYYEQYSGKTPNRGEVIKINVIATNLNTNKSKQYTIDFVVK